MDNLIGNSIKYRHPSREAFIDISCEKIKGSEISEKEAEQGENYYHITVADNGVGFEPAFSEKIFEIFQRLNNQPGSKGSGIGLAICKKIVQNHKGFIRATGEVNVGARIDIYFPAQK
jgi:signal transduction histidine kinase